MKLYSQADFPHPTAEVWSVFGSPAFVERLREVTQITQTVVDRREEGDVVIERVRNVSAKDLPGMVAKALGSRTLTYDQENRLDAKAHKVEWKVHLPVMSDKIDIRGVTTNVATATGCVRTVDGVCNVNIPFVGGRIEKAIVAEFTKSYARAADLARQLLRERNA